MTETSFPIVDQRLSDSAWAQAVGAVGNGILDDWGSPYAVTVNTNDTVTIRTSTVTGFARAVVNGFGHQIDAAVTVAVPGSGSAVRQHVGLLYDPTNAAAPVTLKVLAGTTVPLTAGQEFLPLHVFDRAAGQSLSAAKRSSPLPRIRPCIAVDSAAGLQAMSPRLFLRGTEAVSLATGARYVASGSASSPEWDAGAPSNPLYSGGPSGTVGTSPGKTSTLAKLTTISVDATQVVEISFTSATQVAASASQRVNWAGNLSILVDGTRVGGYRRVGNLNAYGNGPVPADRRVRVELSAGTHVVEVQLSIDSASGGGPYVNNPQIDVWPG